jgi:hypothetical protein
MIIFEPDRKHLDWLQSLKVGDTVYYVNARTLRPIFPGDGSKTQIKSINKKLITIACSIRFRIKDGLEELPKAYRQYCSQDGLLRIVPDLNWSFVDNIALELKARGYTVPRSEIELMMMFVANRAELGCPLTTTKVQALVVEGLIHCQSFFVGYPGGVGEK